MIIAAAARRGDLQLLHHLLPQTHNQQHLQLALLGAVTYGRVEAVRKLLTHVSSIPQRYNELNPVLVAAHHGHVLILQELLQALNIPHHRHHTQRRTLKSSPVHGESCKLYKTAIEAGSVEIVALLVRSGVPQVLDCQEHWTPLMHACSVGDPDPALLRLLLTAPDANLHADRQGRNALHVAAERGCLEITQLLLQFGVQQIADSQGDTPLGIASSRGHYRICRLLLQNGAQMSANMYGKTPLYSACIFGYTHICRLLLDFGADVQTIEENYPLLAASKHGDVEIMTRLIDLGADYQESKGSTAIHEAVKYNHIDAVSLLVERDLFDLVNHKGRSALHVACLSSNNEIARLLLQKGLKQLPDSQGVSPLYFAVMRKNIELVMILLEYCKGPIEDIGALCCACRNGCVEIVQLLIEAGVDPTQQSCEEYALSQACLHGHEGVVRHLLAHGVSPEPSTNGGNPLDIACEEGHFRIVDLLVNAGALRYNCPNALNIALRRGRYDIAQLLLSNGVNCDNVCWASVISSGYVDLVKLLIRFKVHDSILPTLDTPVSIATKCGQTGILRLLLEAGLVQDPDERRRTPLHYASEAGRADLVELLLEFGADPRCFDDKGKIPLDFASPRRQSTLCTAVQFYH